MANPFDPSSSSKWNPVIFRTIPVVYILAVSAFMAVLAGLAVLPVLAVLTALAVVVALAVLAVLDTVRFYLSLNGRVPVEQSPPQSSCQTAGGGVKCVWSFVTDSLITFLVF